jgi:hypothetical protein
LGVPMAAWHHTTYWTPILIQQYRDYVQAEAPKKLGNTADCADLSITLIIDFASSRGLPLTFIDNDDCVYISKGWGPISRFFALHGPKNWNSIIEYRSAVQSRISARALSSKNTIKNAKGPEPGDFLSSPEHTALVFAVYPPGVRHPKSANNIPVYPGPNVAETQLNVLEYFRDKDGRSSGPPKPSVRFDYLNHRGTGKPVKQKAELIYYANVDDPDFSSYEFRKFHDTTFWNYIKWDGEDDIPDEFKKWPYYGGL